jgi:cold shock CspA family protein
MRGRVKWFSSERGYGFITDVQNRDHRFTVRDVIGGALPTGGETTEFVPGSGDRGAFARTVRIIASAPVGWGAARSGDDRVGCRHCGRRMVPRVITYRGAVERTVCPFCANTHQDLNQTVSLSARTVGWILLMAVGLSGLLVFLS